VAALGKLLRTTAFQLTLVYLFIFVVFAASLLGYFALNTRRLINEQITRTVTGEINRLRDQYTQAGIRGLVLFIDLRSRRPGSSLYLVTTPSGEGLAGNVGWKRLTAASKRPTTSITARWCRWWNCPAASAFWSGAIWKSASAFTASSPTRAAGRLRSSSSSGLPVDSLSAAACSSASTR
jgi:hypothetical protein